MALKLLGHYVSQPSRAVIWLCRIQNLPFEFVKVDPTQGQTRTDEFRAINPMGTIPTLVDGTVKIGESHAIMTYLCEKEGWTNWYPKDLPSRAKVDCYMHWHHQHSRLLTSALFRQAMFKALGMGRDDIDEQIAAGKKKAARVLSDIERLLQQEEGQKYIASKDCPTIADLACYCEVDQLEILEVIDFSPYPHIMNWMERIKGLPHYEEMHKPLFKFKTKFGDKLHASL